VGAFSEFKFKMLKSGGHLLISGKVGPISVPVIQGANWDNTSSKMVVTQMGLARVIVWVHVALRPAPIPPCFTSGPPGASYIPRVPSGPSGISLDPPPVCPPVPLVSLGSYSIIDNSIVIQ
jgi:hypothetical protein